MAAPMKLGPALFAAALGVTSCAPGTPVCKSNDDCSAGETCVLGEATEGVCTGKPGNDAGPDDGGSPNDGGDSGTVDPLPPVVVLTASPEIAGPNENVVLTWQIERANTCTLSGGALVQNVPPTNGSTEVTIDATTRFELECTNDHDTRADDVEIQLAVGITNFSPDRPSLNEGGSATFSWTTHGAESCTLTGPSLSHAVPATDLATGGHDVTPEASGEYTLTCEGPGGPVHADSPLTVARFTSLPSATPEVVAFADPSASETVTLSWSLDDAGDGACDIVANGSPIATDVIGGTHDVDVDADTQSFTIRCDGHDPNDPLEETIEVPALISSLAPAQPVVNYTGSTTLDATLHDDVVTCTVNNGPSIPADGTLSTGPLAESADFHVTCTDDDDRSASASTRVSVRPTKPVLDARLEPNGDPNDNAVSNDVVLSWTVNAANHCDVSGGANDVVVTGGVGELRLTTGSGKTSYTVTCESDPDVVGTASDAIQVWWGDADKSHLGTLSGVHVITGQLDLINTTSPFLTELSSLREVGRLRLDSAGLPANQGVSALDGLAGLRHVARDLIFENNGRLQTLALPNLVEVGGALTISSNGSLTGLLVGSLTDVGGAVTIEDSASLQALDGFSCLSRVGDPTKRFTVFNAPDVSCNEIAVVYCALDTPRPSPDMEPTPGAGDCPGITSTCTTSEPLTCTAAP